MTFEQFISEIEQANPTLFKAERISIKVASLRIQLRRAYDAGCAEGYKAREDMANLVGGKNENGDLFSQLFGKSIK